MSREHSAWRPVTAAALKWTTEGNPRSLSFGDIYYSRDNGLAESRYLFLAGNDLPGRWLGWPGKRFCVGEAGFGTGLNFLLTWQAWRAAAEPRPELHYLAVEKYPLSKADLARAASHWPELKPLATALLACYPGLVPGQHRLLLDGGRVTLDLWWEDIADALPDLAGRGQVLVDAWYLDGFAPDRNEAMWQPLVLEAVALLSRPGATFSTFTAAGQVRRQLTGAGFTVTKAKGHGYKRECLRGILEQPAAAIPEPGETPWDLPRCPPAPPRQAIILGAGLAGCTAAWSLARRGVEVTLLEQGKLAAAGSGNDQGVLYTRLSRRHSPLTDFALQSYRFSTTLYRDLFDSGMLKEGLDGALCGSFHQSDNSDEMAALATLLETVPELARVLAQDQVQAVLGIEQAAAGYWYPRSGWLRPASVCRALVAHPNIRLLEDCGPVALAREAQGWRVSYGDRQAHAAACVIIAAGTASVQMAPLAWLPVQAIRGQTTQLPSTPDFDQLRAALCHEGYIAPARNGEHCIGATFNLDDAEPTPRGDDHGDNLARLARAVPAWRDILAELDPASLGGRVGFRCASPDYLPLVGPVPDRAAFLRDYAALRKNARQVLPIRGDYLPGLYLSTAHGSRGLTSTPLAAELLASLICAEPAPLNRELCRALAPARFIIRDLRRNRV
jgi:tRNA 5-methylaminomethyl-2-thiouridine biosynthesis bifunctional protein